MTYYSKCKHTTDGLIILESNILSTLVYFNWSESVGVFGDRTICWECFCKDKFRSKK